MKPNDETFHCVCHLCHKQIDVEHAQEVYDFLATLSVAEASNLIGASMRPVTDDSRKLWLDYHAPDGGWVPVVCALCLLTCLKELIDEDGVIDLRDSRPRRTVPMATENLTPPLDFTMRDSEWDKREGGEAPDPDEIFQQQMEDRMREEAGETGHFSTRSDVQIEKKLQEREVPNE